MIKVFDYNAGADGGEVDIRPVEEAQFRRTALREEQHGSDTERDQGLHAASGHPWLILSQTKVHSKSLDTYI